MSNRPELRRRISIILWDFKNNVHVSDSSFKWVDRILADPDILIRADNQDFPIYHVIASLDRIQGMQEMVKTGWVKIEPKETK